MMLQMDALIEELKKSENLEQMAELENEIAGVLGSGFLKGRFDYQYLIKAKGNVEQIEAERREKFAPGIQIPAKRTLLTR